MKQIFKVFKLEDGQYFNSFNGNGIAESDNLMSAFLIESSDDVSEDYIDQIRKLKGKFVEVTLTDEQPLSKRLTFNKRKEPATFKGKIAMIKREQNLSERTLSDLLGCGKSTIHGWLNGSVPSRKFRKKIKNLWKDYYED